MTHHDPDEPNDQNEPHSPRHSATPDSAATSDSAAEPNAPGEPIARLHSTAPVRPTGRAGPDDLYDVYGTAGPANLFVPFDPDDPDAIVLKPPSIRRRLVALLVVIGVLCIAGATLIGVALNRSNGSTKSLPTRSVASTSAPSVSASPTAVPTVGATSSRSETVPGANALSVSGGGASVAAFTPSSAEWTVTSTTTCPVGATFALDVIDPTGLRIGGWTAAINGQQSQAIHGSGTFELRIGGGCGWTVSARG